MARKRKRTPNKKTTIVQTKEANNQTLDEKKSWGSRWKTILGSVGLLLLLPLMQIVFGDGAFWHWRNEDFEKDKYKIELYEKLHSHVAQALQLGREQKEACFRQETSSSKKYYVALSDSEKAETGCNQKEKSLSLLNQTITVQEKELAKLEDREPRDLTVEIIIPPAPPGRITVTPQ